jgi:SHS2 domain-containing protein
VSFELLDHPADVGFRAHAATLPQLFAECASALVSIILDPANVEPAQRFRLTAEGSEYESLLVNWLNEVLYYTDARRLALGRFDISLLSDTAVECVAHGEPRDPLTHPARLIVKAVTYHQLRVTQETSGAWSADVYVDV